MNNNVTRGNLITRYCENTVYCTDRIQGKEIDDEKTLFGNKSAGRNNFTLI